ncbi:hypothetical protein PFISCL1PPCAC_7134, partial [Pristionchus fissidentatus]
EAALSLARFHCPLSLDLPQNLIVTERFLLREKKDKYLKLPTNRSFPFTPSPRKKSRDRMAAVRSFLRNLGVSGTSQTISRDTASGGMEESRRG